MKLYILFMLPLLTVQLHAMQESLPPLHQAAKDGNLKLVMQLIHLGADIDAQTNTRVTPLVYASQEGHLQVTQWLVKHGANINAHAINNLTPLHWAAFKGHLQVVQCLVKHGANTNAQTIPNHNTPLHFAAKQSHFHIVRFLALHHANLAARDTSNRISADVAATEEIRNYLNETVPAILPCTHTLMLAAATNDIQNLRQAITSKADVNSDGLLGNTPLHYMAQHGNWQAVYYLLMHGANPRIENDAHETAIHAAVRNHRYNILGVFGMIAAGNTEQAQSFSQYIAAFINNNRAQERPRKRQK